MPLSLMCVSWDQTRAGAACGGKEIGCCVLICLVDCCFLVFFFLAQYWKGSNTHTRVRAGHLAGHGCTLHVEAWEGRCGVGAEVDGVCNALWW